MSAELFEILDSRMDETSLAAGGLKVISQDIIPL